MNKKEMEREKALQEQLLDDMLAAACSDYVDALARQLDGDGRQAPPHTFSASFEKRMNRILRRNRIRERVKRLAKATLRSAAVAAAVLVVGSAVVLHVDALRVPVVGFLIDTHEKFTSLRRASPGDILVEPGLQRYLPQYVPEGFSGELLEGDKHGFTLRYTNGDEQYLFQVMLDAGVAAIDTEDAVVENTEINGWPVLVSRKDGFTIMAAMEEEATIIISGNIDQDVIIKIMQSIKT